VISVVVAIAAPAVPAAKEVGFVPANIQCVSFFSPARECVCADLKFSHSRVRL
jgi:hypothetical protein